MRLSRLFLSYTLLAALTNPAFGQAVDATPATTAKAAARAQAAEVRTAKISAARARAASLRAARLAAARAKAAKRAAARAKAKAKGKTSPGLATATATSATAGSAGASSSDTDSGADGSPIDVQETVDPGPILTPYLAFAWHAPIDPLAHVAAPVWYTKDSDPADVADQLKALPAGQRVLLRWQDCELLVSNSDAIVGPDGENYWGPWLDNGSQDEAAFEDSFMSQLAADGATVDYLVLDTEWDINTWDITLGQLNAILADPRFEPLSVAYNLTRTDDLIDILNPDSQAFDEAMQETIGGYDHAAFDAPLVAHFPQAHCSDFNDALLSATAAIESPDANGCVQPAGLPLHGDTQSPSFYGVVGNIGFDTNDEGADFTTPMPVVCWEASRARGYALADVPIIPWVPGKTWSEDALANSPYYDEMVYHVMLGGGSVNVDLWDADMDHTQDDCAALDADMAAVAKAANNEPTLTPLNTDAVPYTSTVLVSGAQCPSGRQVFRITVGTISAQDQTVNVTLPGDTTSTAIVIPANNCGQWFTR